MMRISAVNNRDGIFALEISDALSEAEIRVIVAVLEATRYKARVAERDRIIKLLEANRRQLTTIEGGQEWDIAAEVIALIKGENK
jgi:hypothetical protein